ncbi:DUF4383 domain-containing protein [Thermostaphylospora chromogena]|uniref:DUF4383 domain-containing protein n=1 Tax=Thermostaphylospora chromogena TaxID=35622 RepID=A0A1H1B3X5_9ACTN|nr:DUF4383 domain-containing protein [Thermostaphylospora chromogena]SDQ46645.1 protein of unknown function [Thermostaphylospora chromogena]
MTKQDVRRRSGWTVHQLLAAVIGGLYLLAGIAGFFVTGFDDFARHGHESLLGFGVNPLHNIVHILIGVLGLGMAASLSLARGFGWVLMIVYTPALLYGSWAVSHPERNFLNINVADNWLHFVSVLAGLALIVLPSRRETRKGVATPEF